MNTPCIFLLGTMCLGLGVTLSAESAGGSAGAGGASTSASATSDASLPSPMGSDTDEDGISDWDEVYLRGSSPNNPDTDGDGVGDAQDGWPRVKWLTIPPLPEMRYAVIPLRATGWPIDATAQEIDDKGDVLGSQNSAYIFLQAGTQQPVTVPIGPSWVWMGWGDLLGALSPDGYVVGSVTTVSNGNVTVDGYEDSESNAAIWSLSEGITQFPHMDDGYNFSGPPDVFGRYGVVRAINRSGVVVGMQSASMNIAYQREDDPGPYYLGPVGGSVGGTLYSTPASGGAWLGSSGQQYLHWNYVGDEVWYDPPLLGYGPITVNDQGLIGAIIMEQYANTAVPSGGYYDDYHAGSVVIENDSVYRLDPSPDLPVRIRQITSGTPIVIFGDEGDNPNNHPWWAHRENDGWIGEPLVPFDPLASEQDPSAHIYYANSSINDRIEVIFSKQVVANQTSVITHSIVRNGVVHALDSMIYSGWNVTNAMDINNHGVILVDAKRTSDAQGLPITNPTPEPVLLVPASLMVDADHDELISDKDLIAVSATKPFRFAANDDDDDPGATAEADYLNSVVDGVDDLADFFPVFLDIKQLLAMLPPGATVKYKLKQADGGLNFVYTNLTRATAFDYQNAATATTGYGPNAGQAAAVATTQQITAAGIELPAAFLTNIKDNDQGVILIELRGMTAAPLKLVVEKDNVQIAEVAVNIATGEIKWESIYSNNQVEDFRVPVSYATYTTKDLKWLEGKRYFIDGDGPTGACRNTINVKVKMAGAAGKSFTLKAFDVDDPTPSDWSQDQPNVIDANDAANGPAGSDNITLGGFMGFFETTATRSATATLDGNGEATIKFLTSTQPGNNFRIAVQLNDSAGEIDMLQITNSTAVKYVSADNQPVRGFAGVISPVLTIWRKLHVEIDSMVAIPTEVSSSQKNYASGVIVGQHSSGPLVILDLSEELTDISRYNEPGAHIEIDGLGTFPSGSPALFFVEDNDTIKFNPPGGIMPTVVGLSYKIYDDDFEIIPLALTSIAGPVVDRLKAYYAPTFIEPRLAQNGDTTVGFVLNQDVPPVVATSVTWNDAQNTTDSAYFWQHLVTLGHQGPTGEDMDGDVEQYLGATLKNGIFGRYTAMFTETIRDSSYMNAPRDTSADTQKLFIDWVAMIVAHELGHAPGMNSAGLDHGEKGIMIGAGDRKLIDSFSAKSILRFRSVTTWNQP